MASRHPSPSLYYLLEEKSAVAIQLNVKQSAGTCKKIIIKQTHAGSQQGVVDVREPLDGHVSITGLWARPTAGVVDMQSLPTAANNFFFFFFPINQRSVLCLAHTFLCCCKIHEATSSVGQRHAV